MITKDKQGELKSLGAYLARTLKEYYRDEEHRKKFSLWYEKTYGKPYEWRKS